jgi:hypothetical protein
MALIALSLDLATLQFWLCVGAASLGAAIGTMLVRCIFSRRPHCPICHRWKRSRPIGSVQRDALSAKEALEAGDLAALRALSPEGATVFVSVSHCRKCSTQAPIDVLFTSRTSDSKDARKLVELAHVTYPGSALPAFERLCKKS